MPLIRQIRWLLLATLLAAFAGSGGLVVLAARQSFVDQLTLKNNDNAALIAMVLGQQKGDRGLMDLVLSAQFDTGFYRSIRFLGSDGQLGFARVSAAHPDVAPNWFVRLLPMAPAPGVAQVGDGWRALGKVEVQSQLAYAHDSLWRACVLSVSVLAALAVALAWLAHALVERIRKPLDATTAQATALVQGEFQTVPEPHMPDLRRLVQAMNAMVHRLKQTAAAQAQLLETARRQAHTDTVSGLANRTHFLAQVAAARQGEHAVTAGSLMLLRLLDVVASNHRLGHVATDQRIASIGQVLRGHADALATSLVGRLNGGDFALLLPADVDAAALATAIASEIAALSGGDGDARTTIAAARFGPDDTLAEMLAAADLALAQAESRGQVVVGATRSLSADPALLLPGGQGAWRAQLLDALAAGRAMLVNYPVVDAQGTTIRVECPLRLQLAVDGPALPAATWLPLALRCRATAAMDDLALRLALDQISADGQPRCIHLAAASLRDSGFALRLRRHLLAQPDNARRLAIAVPEAAAVADFDLLQEVARQCRPLGVQMGLSQAGSRLGLVHRLVELGLDFVKLDAAVVQGIGADSLRADYLRSLVVALHGLSIQVVAEGIGNQADAEAVWAAGVDAQTGAWVSSLHPPRA